MANPARRDRIFISYRRSDGAGHAGRLRDDLARQLGERVFMDVSDIAPGADFERVLRGELATCGAVLALIGTRWRETLDAPREGQDYVRFELAQALGHDGVQVVPVLIQGASLPTAAQLPVDLQALAGRQATVLRDDRWQDDVAHLARELRAALKLPRPALRWIALGAVVALVALGLAIALTRTPAPAAFARARAVEIALAATTKAAAACRPAAGPAGVCPLVLRFTPDGHTGNVYFNSGACPLKAPPFGDCVLGKLAAVRIAPFNDVTEAEVGLNLRVDAGGSVQVTPDE